MRDWVRAVALVLLLPWTMGGCGGSEDAGAPSGSYEKLDGAYEVTLARTRETELSGRAIVEPASAGSLKITLFLHKTRSDRQYNAHLHRGSCAGGAGGGQDLTPVSGRTGDTATRSAHVKLAPLNPTFNHVLMVHRPDQHHVLCGRLPPVSSLRELAEAFSGAPPGSSSHGS